MLYMVPIILIINVVYISLLTLRTMFTLKGKRYLASFISAGEAFVFVVGIGLVLENLNEIQNLVAYAVGFALGVLVGSRIEENLALGYVTVKVISKKFDSPLSQDLRTKGFGVTSWCGEGRGGKRMVLEVLTSRKDQRDLYRYIIDLDPDAFVISYEPQFFRGGFWVNSLRKYCKKNGRPLEFPFEDNLPVEDPVETMAEGNEMHVATDKNA